MFLKKQMSMFYPQVFFGARVSLFSYPPKLYIVLLIILLINNKILGRGRGQRGRGRGQRGGRGKAESKEWQPVTKLGRLVKGDF